MSNKVRGGNKQIIHTSTPDLGQLKQAENTQGVKKTQQKGPIDTIEAQPLSGSLVGTKSPLQGVIQEGLTQLAAAEGWEAQQNALDVLVGAMLKSPNANKAETTKADAMSAMGFGQVLSKYVPVTDRAKVKGDAQQLATLAVVALGTDGLAGTRKSDQEEQIKTDLKEIKGALSSVMELAPDQRAARLDNLSSDLSWVAGVLGRTDVRSEAPARIDALVGMLKILSKYAQN